MQAFRTFHDPEVALWVKKLTVDFSNWYLENIGVGHQFNIYLRACGALQTPSGLAMACFLWRNDRPCIYIATWWYYWREYGWVKNREEARDEILDSLAHELIHYEKQCRKIPSNHRGLQQRANSLVRRFNEHQESRYTVAG